MQIGWAQHREYLVAGALESAVGIKQRANIGSRNEKAVCTVSRLVDFFLSVFLVDLLHVGQGGRKSLSLFTFPSYHNLSLELSPLLKSSLHAKQPVGRVQYHWCMGLEEGKSLITQAGYGIAHSKGKASRLYMVVRGNRRILGDTMRDCASLLKIVGFCL